jgi:DNA polymerase-4
VGRTVVLRVRFDDFTRATRSRTLGRPTAHTGTILEAMQELMEAARPLVAARGLTLVGVSIANLEDDVPRQLVLPFDDADMALDLAVDRVRERFGRRSVTRAVVLGVRSRRWSVDVEDLED